jgi:lipoprotein-anchoring transpeptidase ErfK/SrfK
MKKPAIYLIVPLIIIAVIVIVISKTDLLTKLKLEIAPTHDPFHKAELLFNQSKYAEAYDEYAPIYKKDPASETGAKALVQMARLAERLDNSVALEHWQTITANPALKPNHPEAWYKIARYYDPADMPDAATADMEKAERIYRDLFEKYGKNEYASLSGLRLAQLTEQRHDYVEAKAVLDELDARKTGMPEVEQALYRLNIRLIFSPVITEKPKSSYYNIKSGDVLEKIAGKFGTTADLIMASNSIKDPRRIRVGDRIKVVQDKFHIVISKSQNVLSLLTENMVLKKYQVGTGKFGKTPIGSFVINDKIVEPTWYSAEGPIPFGDPGNVLGSRWLALESTDAENPVYGYGIHGTWEPDSIGKQSSAGCIRLINSEVEELYKIVPVGTKVEIIE